jgi:outer membrane lipoprotein-sorting protein
MKKYHTKNLFQKIIFSCLLGLSLPIMALDGEELLQKVDRNLQPESYEMYRKLINIEPDGNRKEFVLYTIKKGQEKMVALFLDPPSEKGRSSLRLGDNMWLYIPNVGKPIRITSLQSVIGGVFNNSDILRLDYSVEYTVTSFEEQTDAYLLDLQARNKTVAYDRLKMWVDKKALVPVTIEAYTASDESVMLFSNIRKRKFADEVFSLNYLPRVEDLR